MKTRPPSLEGQHGRRLSRNLLSIFLLLLFLGVLAACDDDPVVLPGNADAPSQVWGSESLGDAHNEILAAFQQEDPTLEPRVRLRRAVLKWVENSPHPTEEFRTAVAVSLSDPVLVRMERGFHAWVKLVTEGDRSPQQIQDFLETFEGVDARTIGKVSAFVSATLGEQPDASQSLALQGGPHSEAFVDVFWHSHDYWSQSQVARKNKGEDIGLVLSDAVGALGGLFAGPIGSIVGGALYSSFWIATGPSDASGGCGSCHN